VGCSRQLFKDVIFYAKVWMVVISRASKIALSETWLHFETTFFLSLAACELNLGVIVANMPVGEFLSLNIEDVL
jgi:hypothetical protein